jgi:hypothetical protein
MIFFILLALCGNASQCEEVCCSNMCQELCSEDQISVICPLFLAAASSESFLCMKQFLLAETELRTLFYYFKYGKSETILQQLLIVIKILPVFHADCYPLFNS